MTKKRDPSGASRKSPQEKNPDLNFMTSATSNKLITVEGVEYPAEIQFPRLDVRAALIRHWLDKSFVEDAFLTGSFVMDASNLVDETFKTSIMDLVTPQVWEHLEEVTREKTDGEPYKTRASVLQGFYEEFFFTIHPTQGKIGLVPKLGMAISELADRYAKPGVSYVELFSDAAKHGLIGHPDLFETPGTGIEGLG